jgi:hypothetical protein
MGIIHTYAKVLDEYRRDAVKKLEEYRHLKVVGEITSGGADTPVN